ncbi:MAG: fumarylacetoacetate hydrolase family protein [Candidatus Bathyarchaeota archaeon]|nr:fumarylacetoacetate hydrolase family protein [Candidatus Bathyarchaeota archaeon]
MKLARFTYKNEESYGILTEQTVISLSRMATRLFATLPTSMDEFVVAGQMAYVTVKSLLDLADPEERDLVSIPLSDVQLLAPIKAPPKILCLGWNYLDHTAETKTPPPEEPVVFMKPHTAITGPCQKILKRPFVQELDYEGELAVVIGKTAKDVPESEAMKYVFGYTVLNDVSARDFQFKDKQWTRGKGFDTFAPMGPCLVTQDEIKDPANLNIRTWVNGDLRQDGNTKDMLFNIPKIIYHLSRVMTLKPCDIIATGTPSGVGMAMNPQVWLRDGDVVRIEVEGIGTLENHVEER